MPDDLIYIGWVRYFMWMINVFCNYLKHISDIFQVHTCKQQHMLVNKQRNVQHGFKKTWKNTSHFKFEFKELKNYYQLDELKQSVQKPWIWQFYENKWYVNSLNINTKVDKGHNKLKVMSNKMICL